MTSIILIRHGEAHANVNRIVGGLVGDTGLTPRGVEQATRLRDRLAATREIVADVLLASSLRRAHETAEIIAPALGLPVTLDDELQELRPGDADGLSLSDALSRFGIPDFEGQPGRPICPNGESWSACMDRAGKALERIARDHDKQTIVIVTHGGFIDGAFVHFLRLGSERYLPVQFSTRHGSMTRWEHRRRFDGVSGWYLVSYNDVWHLRDDASAPRA